MEDEVINQPEAWQSDVFGQRDNDLFLAQFAQDQGAPVPVEWPYYFWNEVVYAAYQDDSEIEPADVVHALESVLEGAGWIVVWDGGVYIYDAETYDQDAEEK